MSKTVHLDSKVGKYKPGTFFPFFLFFFVEVLVDWSRQFFHIIYSYSLIAVLLIDILTVFSGGNVLIPWGRTLVIFGRGSGFGLYTRYSIVFSYNFNIIWVLRMPFRFPLLSNQIIIIIIVIIIAVVISVREPQASKQNESVQPYKLVFTSNTNWIEFFARILFLSIFPLYL